VRASIYALHRISGGMSKPGSTELKTGLSWGGERHYYELKSNVTENMTFELVASMSSEAFEMFRVPPV